MEKKESKKTTAKKAQVKKTVKPVKEIKKVKPVKEEIVKEEVKKETVVTTKAVAKNKGRNVLALSLLITFGLAVICSWLIKSGSFSGTTFTEGDYARIGLNEIFTSSFYGVYYFIIQIILLVVIAGFYGVVGETKCYQKLVSIFAKLFKNNGIFAIIATSIILTVLASFGTQPLVLLCFVPFLIAVMNTAKMDKIVTFSTTFGSILVGILGATYGTEVLTFFSYYAGSTITDLMPAKVIILVIGFLLFNAFNIIRYLKTNNSDKALLAEEEAVTLDVTKTQVWPIAVIFGLMVLVLVLGYIDWNLIFKVTKFGDLHQKITEFAIGKNDDFFIISNLLGNVSQFGSFPLETAIVVMLGALVLISATFGIKFNNIVDNFVNGIKKSIKPIVLVSLAYSIFVLVYWSPFIPTIVNFIMDIDSPLAPFYASVCGMISSIFNVDYGYTAYTIGTFFASAFPEKVSAISLVLTSIYGLMMFVCPTSIIMVYGLESMNISYHKWLKHIWKFALIMLVALEVIYFIIL